MLWRHDPTAHELGLATVELEPEPLAVVAQLVDVLAQLAHLSRVGVLGGCELGLDLAVPGAVHDI